MTNLDAMKAAAAKLQRETGDDGTNDGEHDAALEMLRAWSAYIAEAQRLTEKRRGTVSVRITEEQARDLHTLANSVIAGLRVGMPDSGMIRRDLLNADEEPVYDLSRAVLLALAPWVLSRRPARGGR